MRPSSISVSRIARSSILSPSTTCTPFSEVSALSLLRSTPPDSVLADTRQMPSLVCRFAGGSGWRSTSGRQRSAARQAQAERTEGGTGRTRREPGGRLLAIVMQDRGMHAIPAMLRYDSPGTRVPRNLDFRSREYLGRALRRAACTASLRGLEFLPGRSSIPENGETP